MLNYFKKKWGKDKGDDGFFSPLRVALHSTVTVDTIDIITLKDSLNPLFELPSGDMEVLAIGNFDMDGAKIWQIYCQDDASEEFVLQVVQGKDYRTSDPKVDEISLYKQVITIEPETQASLNRALNDIGYMTIQVEGVTYDRLWGDQFTEKMDFKTYHEKVVTPQGTENYVDNYILYGRDIKGVTGETLQEFLLVGLEETEDEAQIMMQLGLTLNINTVSVR